ncbi:transmembrane protein, putative (macronuclear) [Tetrahymena thermophila SB210]|uniref:Transmembrane protein, putative n=1 Tax=Tetrahymena thermophila (strain SB210) TaxID=312017 RepID=Q23WS7_TETTS|nr:transmembrane protein, putative [Tetrahymena thermophila SB210]EAS01018.1 transmembrane protein, putative [Tetrahymena thermophila SB210]|eukprot:XP_001021263.1 transmembrane protein, putative [Tetrahymena thermophila SB210]
MNQPQQQGGAGNCMDDLKRWWTTVPFGSKLIYYVTLGLFFLNMFTGVYKYLYNSPDFILRFQVWRMFTTQFVDELMGTIFGLLSLTFTAIALERSIGTVTFILDFMFKNFLIQLLNFIILIMLNLAFKTGTNIPSFGLFNIVILYMSLRCFSDPETSSNFMCFPIQIKNKFQPFAILLFFTLLSGSLRFDFVAAVILGYVEVKFYGGMMLRLSEQRIASLKNNFIFKPMTSRSDFVEQGGSFLVQTNAQNQNQQPAPSASNFSGRGVSIGGDPLQQASSSSQQPQSRPNQQQYVINPSQDQNSQAGGQFQQFAGKGVSIGGGATAANTLSIQQQRELQLKRLQQQQESEYVENKLEMDTNVDSSNDSNNNSNQAAANRNEQKNQTKKDGYSVLNEDLL